MTERRVEDPFEKGPRRFFDPRLSAYVVKVLPGDVIAGGAQDEVLVTVLGSCISCCIHDPALKIGVMNHFMLPGQKPSTEQVRKGALYGIDAIEQSMHTLMKLGAHPNRLEIRYFGGAARYGKSDSVGEANSMCAQQYFGRSFSKQIAATEVGGDLPRRIEFWPHTGRVKRRFLRRTNDPEIFSHEEQSRKVDGFADRFPTIDNMQFAVAT